MHYNSRDLNSIAWIFEQALSLLFTKFSVTVVRIVGLTKDKNEIEAYLLVEGK